MRRSHRCTGGFRAAAGTSTDGTEESNGIAALDSAFPHGVFTVQDGDNAPAPGEGDDGDRTDTHDATIALSDVIRPAAGRAARHVPLEARRLTAR